ncbi:RNA-guided endonuclease InsQ/TnpB family protein [Paenarthrobacter sp. NPDC089675]|uniref:RNA-guided endonuclease InsQ/TnpB family protein n=1 Tax=Paenarthrobacter sp. NPDC089675 TaxID=3364376 RepID=UPI00382B25BF
MGVPERQGRRPEPRPPPRHRERCAVGWGGPGPVRRGRRRHGRRGGNLPHRFRPASGQKRPAQDQPPVQSGVPEEEGIQEQGQSHDPARRHHEKTRNRGQHFLHQASNELAKTHARLAIEDLNVAGMLAHHALAAPIADAAWAELARQLAFKQAWRNGELILVDRWFPSSKTCSRCGHPRASLALGERTYRCGDCGLIIDRDLNAAVNLAAWVQKHHAQAPDPEARGRENNACRQERSGRQTRDGEKIPDDAGTRDQTAA